MGQSLRGRLMLLLDVVTRSQRLSRHVAIDSDHRLQVDTQASRLEGLDLVEARHGLWEHISSPKKELIRSFLNVLNLEIVKRMRPSSVFDFAKASVGNLFLTGYRILCCTCLPRSRLTPMQGATFHRLTGKRNLSAV